MSNLFITSAIRDIIPTHPEPYPTEVISYANSLYTTSKRSLSLSNNEEIGRYHLCCYVTIEYFQNIYKLPILFDNKIPIPHKKRNYLLQTFRLLFQSMINSTPRANRTIELKNYLPTPSSTNDNNNNNNNNINNNNNNNNLNSSQSYIDQIKANKYNSIEKVKRSLKNDLLNEISNTSNNNPFQSPPTTPQKNSSSKSTNNKQIVNKLSPYKSRTKIVITTPILVSFCNKFYIPEHITLHILQTFKLYQHIINNSWGLLVGLVGISYIQLNKKEIQQKIGLKSKLINNLQKFQLGGLTNIEVKKYIREITKLISKTKWLKEANYLNNNFNSNNFKNKSIDDDIALSSLSSFLDSSVEYINIKDNRHIEKWVKSIKHSKWMKDSKDKKLKSKNETNKNQTAVEIRNENELINENVNINTV